MDRERLVGAKPRSAPNSLMGSAGETHDVVVGDGIRPLQRERVSDK